MALFLENYLRQFGVVEEKLITSILQIPRERFLPSKFVGYAYDNIPIPLGYNRLAFQPHLVAMMLDAAQLQSTDRVLEIGTGCGYNTALLSKLSNAVYSVECVEELYEECCERLLGMGCNNISLSYQDFSDGLPQNAPYDAILLGVATSNIPTSLYEQLAPNGRLIVPMVDGEGKKGQLIRITRSSTNFPTCYEEELLMTLFDHNTLFDAMNNEEDENGDAFW